MEKERVIKVKVEGGKRFGIADHVFTWDGEDAEAIFGGAINFAQGYATALIDKGVRLGYPMVMPYDGYHWWCDEFSIKVVNEDGKIVRTVEDIN